MYLFIAGFVLKNVSNSMNFTKKLNLTSKREYDSIFE